MTLRDLRSEADGARFATDVCIVGGGPAGITLARELSRTRLRVLLLESGGAERDANADRLNRGESAGLPFRGIAEGRVRAFGGSSKVWDGQCLRLTPIDFEPRSWVPHSGWPITYTELDPFYVRARRVVGIPTDVSDEQIARRFGVRAPALDANKLGYLFAVISHRIDLGRHYWDELERADGVEVLLHATATEIRTNEDASAVEHLEVRTLDGTHGRVVAKAFVLCAGGIENARLLLVSNRVESSGVGNRHDLVGRFFQEHPVVGVGALTTTEPARLQKHFDVLRSGRLRYFPKMPLSERIQRDAQVSNCSAHVLYDYDVATPIGAAKAMGRALRERRWPAGGTAMARRALRRIDHIAATIYRKTRGKLTVSPPSVARVHLLVEPAPDPASRVSLSHERDALGLNQVRLEWRLCELDRRTTRVMCSTIDAEFARVGLARLATPDWLADGGDWTANVAEACHHMGTTRMADDPRRGVVDRDCRVHGVTGLYVAGSSVFPTSGYANPTLTIVALALRLADHLKTVLAA